MKIKNEKKFKIKKCKLSIIHLKFFDYKSKKII